MAISRARMRSMKFLGLEVLRKTAMQPVDQVRILTRQNQVVETTKFVGIDGRGS